jgi:hypothetical protein
MKTFPFAASRTRRRTSTMAAARRSRTRWVNLVLGTNLTGDEKDLVAYLRRL